MSNDYYQSLPTKRMGAAALIRDEAERILIVKPTYRPDWLMPGGTIEQDESPQQGCFREVFEELDIQTVPGRLLCVDYTRVDGEKTEALQFVFDGGILTLEQIAHIQLPLDELSEYRFVTQENALKLLNPKLAKRIPHSLFALNHHTTTYLEDGNLVG